MHLWMKQQQQMPISRRKMAAPATPLAIGMSGGPLTANRKGEWESLQQQTRGGGISSKNGVVLCLVAIFTPTWPLSYIW